jgi:hypothetical protein
MDSDTSRMTGSLLLLLSLLIHILILLFLFWFQTPPHDAQTIEYFDADNQLQANQPDQQQQNQPNDDDHEILIELLSQGIQPNNTLTDDPGEIAQAPLAQKGQEQTPDDTATDDQTEPEDPASSDDASQAEDETKPSDAPPAEEQKKGSSEQPISIPDNTPAPQERAQKQEPARPKQTVKKIVSRVAPRQPMHPADVKMLSKVAQGFMESMSAELGNAPSTDPTLSAHQRYMTKVWNNLKQTMNAEENVLALSSNIDTRAVLVMTINKQGKLLNALLRHPRKTDDISKMESMLLTNAHKVGLFPPLPASFERDQVTFVMPIHLRAQAGIHSGYRLQVEQ